MVERRQSVVPPNVMAMLRGDDIESHIGETLLLCAAEAGEWPRVALLSVGEILAAAPDELRFVLYGSSRTTRAVSTSGRALLVFVCDGTTYKISLDMRPGDLPDTARRGFKGFSGSVVECQRDEVAYARVLHGLEYELEEPASTVARWNEQISWLRSMVRG